MIVALNFRYEKWTDGCGVRIKTMAKKDEGRWRLTATKGNRTYVGWSQIHVYSEFISTLSC